MFNFMELSSLMQSSKTVASPPQPISVHVWRLISRGQQEVYRCPCWVGQAMCSQGSLDIASNLGLEGDRVTDLCGTARLGGQVCPWEVWLHVQRVSCDDGRLDKHRTETCRRGDICVLHVVLHTDLGCMALAFHVEDFYGVIYRLQKLAMNRTSWRNTVSHMGCQHTVTKSLSHWPIKRKSKSKIRVSQCPQWAKFVTLFVWSAVYKRRLANK